MSDWLGRLHPLIVHFPITLLLLSGLLFLLSFNKKLKVLRPTVRITLFFGSLSAVVSCITGLLWMDGAHDASIISDHKLYGLITAFISLLLLFISNARSIKGPSGRRLSGVLYVITVPLLIVTGHLGGTLTHGEGFLTPVTEVSSLKKAVYDPNQPVYDQLIQPILKSKCYSCHSSKKQKGKLRLDSKEFIIKGGKAGAIINFEDPSQSEVVVRLHLPIEDEDHMPPSDNDQLTSGELDLLTSWIKEGTSFIATQNEFKDQASIINYIGSNLTNSIDHWWPKDKIEPADETVLDELVRQGLAIEPLSADNNYLSISFISIDSISSTTWDDILKIKNHVVSLRCSNLKLNQSDIIHITELPSLAKLYLDNTLLINFNLHELKKLNRLLYLNLFKDSLSIEQVEDLKTLKSLTKLILTGSNVTNRQLDEIQKAIPACEIELEQVVMPQLITDTLIYRKKTN